MSESGFSQTTTCEWSFRRLPFVRFVSRTWPVTVICPPTLGAPARLKTRRMKIHRVKPMWSGHGREAILEKNPDAHIDVICRIRLGNCRESSQVPILQGHQDIRARVIHDVCERCLVPGKPSAELVLLAGGRIANLAPLRIVLPESAIKFDFAGGAELQLRPAANRIEPTDNCRGVVNWTAEKNASADAAAQSPNGSASVEFAGQVKSGRKRQIPIGRYRPGIYFAT